MRSIRCDRPHTIPRRRPYRSGCIGASLYPEKLKRWIAQAMSAGDIRYLALGVLAVTVAYWVALYLLKPKPSVRSNEARKSRIEIGRLGEGNFDGITDDSDRQFLKVGETDKLSITNSKFGDGNGGRQR